MSAEVRARGSIGRRLGGQLLLGAALLSAVMVFVVLDFGWQLADESQDDILAASVTSVLDAASVRDGALELDLPYSALSMLGNVTNDRVFYAIRQDGGVLSGYPDLPEAPPGGTPGAPRFRTLEYVGAPVRLVTADRRLSLGGDAVTLSVSVAQTRGGQQQVLARITRTVAGFGAGFFLLSALVAVLTTQTAVAPLRRLAASVARRGPQDLSPVSRPVPSEMAPLVGALNRLMGRLEASLARSEDLIAEAAHRVRTPLATVRAQAETTLRRVEKPENRAAVREMIRAIDESSRAAGQLLDHAMVSFRSDHIDPAPLDLARLAAETVERLRPMAELRDIDIGLDAPGPAPMRGDPILVQNAVHNILDNALKYSPPDSPVRVQVAAQGGAAVLCVRDRGIGFPEGGPAQLTRRFARGDNVDGVVGSGLGLTIVEEVARAHGGALHIAPNPDGGGSCVSLSFPLS